MQAEIDGSIVKFIYHELIKCSFVTSVGNDKPSTNKQMYSVSQMVAEMDFKVKEPSNTKMNSRLSAMAKKVPF